MGEQPGELRRHLGVWQATALNVTMVVGAGVFMTVPFMVLALPGPYALLGWLAAGALILVDALFWSELGAALPGSGGSYTFLLESYGREKGGRLMAFLYIWQFLLSGPLELASGLIAVDTFAQALLGPEAKAFNDGHTLELLLFPDPKLTATFSPSRLTCVLLGALLILLLYREVRTLGWLTIVFGVGVLAVIAWILIEGALRFDAARAFDFSGKAGQRPDLGVGIGAAMTLALYSYLGYYNVCHVGDEVRDPGRTVPRAILQSAVLVVALFVGLHLAMLGTVSWHDLPSDEDAAGRYSLAAAFMQQAHGKWAAVLVTLLLVWSCPLGSFFAGLLGYSRIPYGVARGGHFFRIFATIHPRHNIPHVSLLLVGGATLALAFLDFGTVVSALIVTRILEQFMAQILGVGLLRRLRPDLPRPFRVRLYPLAALLALAGWGYVYWSAKGLYIVLGLATLAAGVVAFLPWAWSTGGWPFVREGGQAKSEDGTIRR